MRGCFAIYYRELLILKKKLVRQIASMSVAPLLYILAFGYGMGKDVTVAGRSYLEFLIPGLVAMNSMTQAFAIASEINIARFYWRIFEEFQAAPIRNRAYVTGEILAGITRAVLSVAVILVIGAAFGVILSYNPTFWLGVVLNGFLFSSLAVCMAMTVKSHADQALLTNFVITPMAFLGGTFFPLDRMPGWVQSLLQFLPLTHAASVIRGASFGETTEPFSHLLLAGLGLIMFVAAFFCVDKAKE
ncbi:MAG: ABC transporter permease [Syntrophobacteraceae bacterium]|jgi:Nod factor-specific ABC transporter NodJ protein|nr:ABC transporter permease [Syntrophobacteraceae bacterium]